MQFVEVDLDFLEASDAHVSYLEAPKPMKTGKGGFAMVDGAFAETCADARVCEAPPGAQSAT